MNYRMDPRFGTPKDLHAVKAQLMIDFVLNQLSAKCELFQKFIENVPGYENAFIHLTDAELQQLDLAPVFRPREHHPIIPFTNTQGVRKNVWCTFSETQADINILEPAVFCLIMEALVKDFVAEGASWIRLDAIGYLVKMLGLKPREASTDCFGIPETHNILKAMRCFFNDVAPGVALVPEVNATGETIATYYGENNDEGHIVYDFPSAPISLYSIYREDAVAALDWARKRAMHPERIGLSFTNTHDGIGVLPMAEVQDAPEGRPALDFFVNQLERRGGGINYKAKLIDG
ncbi:MAG: alpha-amylase family glycosyl hydrolase, partial [Hyphomicrobium sp.]